MFGDTVNTAARMKSSCLGNFVIFLLTSYRFFRISFCLIKSSVVRVPSFSAGYKDFYNPNRNANTNNGRLWRDSRGGILDFKAGDNIRQGILFFFS